MIAGFWTGWRRIFWRSRATATWSGSRAISRHMRKTSGGGWGLRRPSRTGSSIGRWRGDENGMLWDGVIDTATNGTAIGCKGLPSPCYYVAADAGPYPNFVWIGPAIPLPCVKGSDG